MLYGPRANKQQPLHPHLEENPYAVQSDLHANFKKLNQSMNSSQVLTHSSFNMTDPKTLSDLQAKKYQLTGLAEPQLPQ